MSKETEMILEALNNLQNEVIATKTELQTEMAGLKDEMVATKTELQTEMAGLKDEMADTKTELQTEMAGLKGEMADTKTELQTEMAGLKDEVTSIKVTLENVTNRGIKTIAEGHGDLFRQLNEAIKINGEKEQILVRVSLLEDEVRLLKEKFNTIA